ncbi:F-box protein At1g80960 [Triticum aestivum]|uniref:F-box protein At1g80960 n=1 Tax=Triticum aestivum TaxID=4565 RepID=UPI001D009D60|nr:F-box protein At1g80960-like [Triticum aestivum]
MDSLTPPAPPHPQNTEDDCFPPKNALCGHDEEQHVQNCDWISTLPDDILIEILSLMTISEAAMTGFLSTRWRHVWKKVDHLILDSYTFGMQELEKSRYHENPLLWNDVATKFVHKVNGLLHSRYGNKIKELIIRFPLTSAHASNLDHWIESAIVASTEKLFLDLDNKCCKEGCTICVKGMNAASEPYDFLLGPFFNGRADSLDELTLFNCSIGTMPANMSGFSYLKSLLLARVSIVDETVSSIMSNCCALEIMVLQYCHLLVHLTASHARLQILVVQFCKSLVSICIRADNLESFAYMGYKINIECERAQFLEMLHVYFVNKDDCPLDFISAFPKLPKLEFLVIQFPTCLQVYRVLQHASRFAGLTTVMLVLMKPWKEGISSVAYVLKSAPLIEYFGLHGCCKLHQHTQLNITWPEDLILARLYTIIIGGFSGEFELMELVYFLLRSTPALDVFEIDTRAMEPWLARSNEDKLQDDMRCRYAREMAYAHLVPKVPSTVKFHII